MSRRRTTFMPLPGQRAAAGSATALVILTYFALALIVKAYVL